MGPIEAFEGTGGKEMKKVTFVLFVVLMFVSPAYAVIYKWVDHDGVMNFTDDPDEVPSIYRDSVEEVKTPKLQPPPVSQSLERLALNTQPGKIATQPPPIGQNLVREGFFAVKLAQALELGSAQSEAEAESMLASAGIAPRNGWIADYPLTPDIIGELRNGVDAAVDSGQVAFSRDQANTAFEDLISEQALPIVAENEGLEEVDETPQNYGDDSNPQVINHYYYEQGPPIVTYYTPPADYGYLYSWVPFPFRCSGFWFRGFYVLRDFHKVALVNGKPARFTNHTIDQKTRRFSIINPATRGSGQHSSPQPAMSRPTGFSSADGATIGSLTAGGSSEQFRQGNSTPGVKAGPGRETRGISNSTQRVTPLAPKAFPLNFKAREARRGASSQILGQDSSVQKNRVGRPIPSPDGRGLDAPGLGSSGFAMRQSRVQVQGSSVLGH